jgi:hypothetical protein
MQSGALEVSNSLQHPICRALHADQVLTALTGRCKAINSPRLLHAYDLQHCERSRNSAMIRARGETPVLLSLGFFLLVTAWAQLLPIEPLPLTLLGAIVGGGDDGGDNYFGHDRCALASRAWPLCSDQPWSCIHTWPDHGQDATK